MNWRRLILKQSTLYWAVRKPCSRGNLTDAGYWVQYPTHCAFHDKHIGKIVPVVDIDANIPSVQQENFCHKNHTQNAHMKVAHY
jgi:hypothetical protein